jgi:hypothetical protein
MPKHQIFIKENYGTINYYQCDRSQSKDATIKARVSTDVADRIRAFCRERGITVTDYLREYSRLGDVYFDHIETLIKNADLVVPLLKRLSKNF